MTPAALAILFVVIGAVLLAAELLLPTHGVLGVVGGLCFLAAIIVCFTIDRWLGLGVLVGSVALSPFMFSWAVDLWQRTPVGRRVVLPPVADLPVAPPVRIGQTGRTVTELRPGGECDFADLRLEALSEHGLIPAGRPVRVVALDQNRPVVRPLADG